jgi:hypothetical protein
MSEPPTTSARMERSPTRLAEIRADISARLWPVNAGMKTEDFNELIDQMSQLQWNFELRAAASNSAQINTRAGASDRRRVAPALPRDEPTAKDPLPE